MVVDVVTAVVFQFRNSHDRWVQNFYLLSIRWAPGHRICSGTKGFMESVRVGERLCADMPSRSLPSPDHRVQKEACRDYPDNRL